MPPRQMQANFLAAQGGAYQPQMQNQFEFIIAGQGLFNDEIIALSVDTAALPTFTFGEVELHHFNERVYVAGGVTFESVAITCKDFVNVAVAQAFNDWQNLIYNPSTGAMGLANVYKKAAFLKMFGPDGGYERRWKLEGCWPQTVNYGGTLDASAKEAINQIEITLRYDKAIPEVLSAAS